MSIVEVSDIGAAATEAESSLGAQFERTATPVVSIVRKKRMVSLSDSAFTFEANKLGGASNLAAWKFRMRMLMMKEDNW
jgi:hypothetical protein